jgi:hypothetical protein
MSGELTRAKAPTFRSLLALWLLPVLSSAVMSSDFAVMLTSLQASTLLERGNLFSKKSVPQLLSYLRHKFDLEAKMEADTRQ